MLKPHRLAPKAYPVPKAAITREETLQVRGAKRGGLTDHLSGVHLIPNVGREAMVPAEVVSRRRHPLPKKVPEPPKTKDKLKERPRKAHRSDGRSRGHSRDPQRERRRSSSSSSAPEMEEEKKIKRAQEEEERRKQAEVAKRKAEEEKRFAEEQKKLKELEDLRQKNLEMQSARKQRLGGLFALTEDDIEAEEDEEASRARIAREKARIERKALERPAPPDPFRQSYSAPSAAVSSTPRLSSSSSDMVVPAEGGNLTAADIDGSLHDHKFSKVWKDWDAAKKSDPGEIAKQFMKIAAIKRRGYVPGGGGRSGPESRSRSRSRGRARRY